MSSTYRITARRALALTAAVAALAIPTAALAGSGNSRSSTPDWLERYAAAHPYGGVGTIDGRSADTLDAVTNAQQSSSVPDVFERYAATHTYRSGLVQGIDGRSADTLDAATNAQQSTLIPSDGRSPDTLEAASSPRPVVVAQPGGFDWSDAGIGAGFAGGVFALLLALALIMLRRHPRQRIQTT